MSESDDYDGPYKTGDPTQDRIGKLEYDIRVARNTIKKLRNESNSKKTVPVQKRREKAIGSEFKKMREKKGIMASLIDAIAPDFVDPIENEVTKIPDTNIKTKMDKSEEKPKAKRGRKPKVKKEEVVPSPPIPIPVAKSEEPKSVIADLDKSTSGKSAKEIKKEKAAEKKRLAAEKKKKAAERKAKRTPEQQKKINERMAKIRAARNAKKTK